MSHAGKYPFSGCVSSSVKKVSMSGSGATCFGVFENKHDCDLAMKKVRRERPEWWSVSTEIIST